MLNRDRALTLLGEGIPAEQVAAALGVTPSAISQLLSEDEFKEKVLELKFQKLSAHNERDSAADALESKLLGKLEASVDMIYRPLELAKVYSVLNAAKRRGSSAPAHITQQQTIIPLILPTVLIHSFQANQVNQVTAVDNQDLNTIQSGTLLTNLKAKLNVAISPQLEHSHDSHDSASRHPEVQSTFARS